MGYDSKAIIGASKFLSYVLRHAPEEIGLSLDSEGWASIDALLSGAHNVGKAIDADLIKAVVDQNEKKRFAISSDGLRIRAVQGHSTTTVALTLIEKVPPQVLFHGTATRFLEPIWREGLRPGSRHHVHLSENLGTATEVGRRYGVPAILRVDAQAMHKQGLKFYQAENGVWLTDSVPPQFLVMPGV